MHPKHQDIPFINRVSFFVAVLFLTTFVQAQNNRNILYGEHLQMLKPVKNSTRIFYDRNGDLYPAYLITDEKLAASNGSLRQYFATHPADFQKVTDQYKLSDSIFSDDNFQLLQSVIFEKLVTEINKKSKGFQSVVFLLHGFRKPFKKQGRSTTSIQDNNTLKKEIYRGNYRLTDFYFVEIYWDSMYDCCFSKNIFKNRKLFKLFKNEARTNAVVTGYQLRKIVSAVQKDYISMISHSLGARVLVSCLFNAFDDGLPKNQSEFPTPDTKTINICMIAPAISRKPFKFYHQRNNPNDFAENDNYRLFILYNEDDFVLRKKYKGLGPGPKKHGRTTLGCNHKKECSKLAGMFEEQFPNSEIAFSHAANVGICHLVRCYTRSDSFRDLKKFISAKILEK